MQTPYEDFKFKIYRNPKTKQLFFARAVLNLKNGWRVFLGEKLQNAGGFYHAIVDYGSESELLPMDLSMLKGQIEIVVGCEGLASSTPPPTGWLSAF